MLNNTDNETETISNQFEDLFGERSELRVSKHALREAHKEGLRGRDIVFAVLTGTVVERYPNRRRVLIAGAYSRSSIPIHVVCDYSDLFVVAVVTVYIPNRVKWAHPLRRRSSASI